MSRKRKFLNEISTGGFLSITLLLILVGAFGVAIARFYKEEFTYLIPTRSGVLENKTLSELKDLLREEISSTSENVFAPEPLRVFSEQFTDSVLVPEYIYVETNKERAAVGLEPLIVDSILRSAAEEKVRDMFLLQYFEHDSPLGVGVAELVTHAGYKYILVAENLAMGDFMNEKEVVDAWMKSPGHRANILNPRFTEIGIAAKKGTFGGREVWMLVQEFGFPQDACPEVSVNLRKSIEKNQADITETEAELDRLKAELKEFTSSPELYNGKVDFYNALVAEYNNLLSATKNLVDAYNSSVRSFNDCAGV